MTTSRISSTPGASRPSRRPSSCRPLGRRCSVGRPSRRPLVAHDFWIEPSRFRPAPGRAGRARAARRRAVRGRAGGVRPGARRAVRGRRRLRTQQRWPARPATSPRAASSPPRPGPTGSSTTTFPARSSSRPNRSRRTSPRRGSERVSAARREHGESERAGRELYSRCAKALSWSPATGPAPPRELGLELELVLDAEPAGLASGAAPVAPPLPRRTARRRSRRRAAARRAHRRARGAHGRRRRGTFRARRGRRLAGQSGAHGAAPAAPADHADADWESFWASLTLELP